MENLAMKLNNLEFVLVNDPIRAASQRYIESPRLIGLRDSQDGQRVLEIGCGRGVGMEILLSRRNPHYRISS
jgi:protein-L-isoaspartate O-methyltransferase